MAKRVIISLFSLFGVVFFSFMLINYYTYGYADFSIKYFLDNIPDFDLLKYIRNTLNELQTIIAKIKALSSDGVFDNTDIITILRYYFEFIIQLFKLLFTDVLQTLIDLFLWVFQVLELAGSGPVIETPFDKGYLI